MRSAFHLFLSLAVAVGEEAAVLDGGRVKDRVRGAVKGRAKVPPPLSLSTPPTSGEEGGTHRAVEVEGEQEAVRRRRRNAYFPLLAQGFLVSATYG